jgi:ribose-phosphate pyrophosphokinase
MKDRELKIFTGKANPALADKISEYIGMPIGKAEILRFPDNETFVKIREDVRGRDVFVIQSTVREPNDRLMELLIMIDALKRASADRITAVVPCYGYARQDRKDQPRVPITAKLVANLLTASGVDRVLTIDLHADQIQGFFDIPLDNLYAFPVFVDYLRKIKLDTDIVIVSPDVGGLKLAALYSSKMNTSFATVDKRRVSDLEVEASSVVGDVKGKHVILVDDICSTASSIVEACRVLKKNGAKDIYCCVTHAILVDPAIDRIEKAPIKRFLITDTVPSSRDLGKSDVIEVLSVASLLGKAIMRIHRNESVSSLFY